jgi:hypothetical protein
VFATVAPKGKNPSVAARNEGEKRKREGESGEFKNQKKWIVCGRKEREQK